MDHKSKKIEDGEILNWVLEGSNRAHEFLRSLNGLPTAAIVPIMASIVEGFASKAAKTKEEQISAINTICEAAKEMLKFNE